MNKNMAYVAVLAVLCVVTGVVVGAVITKKAGSSWPCPERPNFSERAESFMRHGGEPGDKHSMGHGRKEKGKKFSEGFLEMLTARLELNKDQQVKVREVLEKARGEIDEVGKNVRSAINEIKDRGDKEIMNMLTPEQQGKFKAFLEEFNKRHDHNSPEEGSPKK